MFTELMLESRAKRQKGHCHRHFHVSAVLMEFNKISMYYIGEMCCDIASVRITRQNNNGNNDSLLHNGNN